MKTLPTPETLTLEQAIELDRLMDAEHSRLAALRGFGPYGKYILTDLQSCFRSMQEHAKAIDKFRNDESETKRQICELAGKYLNQ